MIRFLFKLIYRLIIFLAILILAIGIFRTHRTQNSQTHETFAAGSFPEKPLNGLYETAIGDYRGSWKGQIYNARDNSGINIFQAFGKDAERYPFTTSKDIANRESGLVVLKTDYDIPENPFWIRPLYVEIVQTAEDEYLAKMNYRLIPAYDFAVGYYTLTIPEE